MGDWTALKAAKGVGPKTAQRVVIELKDKAPTVMAMMDGEAQIHADDMQQAAVIERAEPAVAATPASAATPSAQADALSALSNLGYAPGEAAAVVAQLSGEMIGADSASLIRAALKKMAPKT
jgi:Holliday junction DNA helicase RuvA